MNMSAITTETGLPMGALCLLVELTIKLEICHLHDELQQAHDVIRCEILDVLKVFQNSEALTPHFIYIYSILFYFIQINMMYTQ